MPQEAWVTFTARFTTPPDGSTEKLVFVDYDSADVYRGLDIRLGTYFGAGGPPTLCWEFNINADPYNVPPYVNMIDPVPEADVDYNIVVHYELSLDGTSCRITPTINGIPATTLETPTSGVFQLPYVDIDWPHASLAAGFGVGELAAGRPYSGDPTKSPALAYLIQNTGFEWTLDNVKIGTSGPGSSDLLNATFDSSMAPFSAGDGFAVVGGKCSATSATDTGSAGWPTAFFPAIVGTMHPATAIYKLGSSWPTLIEDQTDPTEGIRTRLTKSIVPARTPLPEGFADSFPLDIYRSIQIVSKIDLTSLPKPTSWRTSQHVSFPPQLLAVYPIWDQSASQSTAGGGDTGTNRGQVSASVEVHGAIVVTKRSGFRGAAIGRVERQFFATLAEAEVAMDGVEPTIIAPSSGTVILRTTSASSSISGLTYDQSPPLNAAGQPAHVGDTMPGGGTYAGYFNAASRAQSSGATGSRTQVTDIGDVLTAGLAVNTNFSARNQSSADVLYAFATATGSFSAIIPPSTPTIIVPGKAVLAEVVLEKWRFGLYVRHLIYLAAPTVPL